MIILEFIILIYSVILHEIMHGRMADRLGDPTAKIAGRLTLDPIPHIDPLMTLVVPMLLFILGSPVIIGGAKPVPIDTFNFRNPKRDITLVSLAGPITNFIIALSFVLILRIIGLFWLKSIYYPYVSQILIFGIMINFFLGLFNLLPIPPLDGFKVVGGLLPNSWTGNWFGLERFGLFFLLIALLFFNSSILAIIYPVTNVIVHWLVSSSIA